MGEALWSAEAFLHGAFTFWYFKGVGCEEPTPGNLCGKRRADALCGLRCAAHNGRNLQ